MPHASDVLIEGARLYEDPDHLECPQGRWPNSAELC